MTTRRGSGVFLSCDSGRAEVKRYKRVIRDAKRILMHHDHDRQAREFWLALIVKTKGRMGWI